MTTGAYDEHEVPIVFFGYDLESQAPVCGEKVWTPIPQELVSMGHIDQDELAKTFADMTIATIKTLPKDAQAGMIQAVLPEFNAIVDPDKFSIIKSTPEEFEIIAKKCNMWMGPLEEGKTLTTQVHIPSHRTIKTTKSSNEVLFEETYEQMDPAIAFSTLSNLKKHSAMVLQVKSNIGTRDEYASDTKVILVSQISMDVEILTNIIEVLDLISFQINNLQRTITSEKVNPKTVKTNTTIQNQHLNDKAYLQSQLKTLKLKKGEFKQKRNQQYYENILLPKFETLVESWDTMLDMNAFLANQSIWGKRVAQQEAYLKSIKNVLVDRSYFGFGASLIEDDLGLIKVLAHANTILCAILSPKFFDSVEILGRPGNPFDPMYQLSKDNVLLASLMWPELARLLKETNCVIRKTTAHLRRLETEISDLAHCEAFWIKDGVLQPQSLVMPQPFFQATQLYQVPEANLVVYLVASELSLYSFLSTKWVKWNVTLTIPKAFDVSQIIAKQSWLVLQLSLELFDRQEGETDVYNTVGFKKKLAYLAVFELNHVNRTIRHHFTLPTANIIHVGFSEDHSHFVTAIEDIANIDDTMYCIMTNMDIYQISLREKKFRWITAVTSDDQTILSAVSSRLKKVILKSNSYTILTGNDVLIMGPMVSDVVKTKTDEEQTTEPKKSTQKITYITLQATPEAPILDIAEQNHIIAVAQGNGMVNLIDKELGESKNILEPPKGLHPKERGLFHAKEGLCSVVFNSNEEILLFNNKGACLSWKLNIPQ